MVLAASPATAMRGDAEVITLTVMLTRGGTEGTRRCEQLAWEISKLDEQRAALRLQHAHLREELDLELAGLVQAVLTQPDGGQ